MKTCPTCGHVTYQDARKQILREVSRVSGVSMRAITSGGKTMRVVDARITAAVMLREHLSLGPTEVAEYLKSDRTNWYYWARVASKEGARGQRIRSLVNRAESGLRR